MDDDRTVAEHPGGVAAALSAAVDVAAAAAWWRCSDAQVRAAVVDLDRQAARLDAARARLLAEAHARDVAAAVGAASTAAWYAAATGARPERAGRRVQVAAALQGPLAATGAALAAGEITWEHAEVIDAALARLGGDVDPATRAEAQAFLVHHGGGHTHRCPTDVACPAAPTPPSVSGCDTGDGAAPEADAKASSAAGGEVDGEQDAMDGVVDGEQDVAAGTGSAAGTSQAGATPGWVPGLDPRRLARLARALAHRLDPDAGDRLARAEDTAERGRRLTCVETDDGTWLLHAVLDPAGGAALRTALDARNTPRPTGPDATRDTRPRARRDADALLTILDEWAAAGSSSGPGLASSTGPGLGARPTLVVTVSTETLAAPPGTPGVQPATTHGGLVLSAATAQILACDAAITPVLLAPDGTPLDAGRTRYTFPDRIRTAVLHRDHHACSRCHRADLPLHLHHLHPWSTGGPTSERNGTAVCPPCHRTIHRHGWTGELTGTKITWHPPDRTPPHLPPGAWTPALRELVNRWLTRRAA